MGEYLEGYPEDRGEAECWVEEREPAGGNSWSSAGPGCLKPETRGIIVVRVWPV